MMATKRQLEAVEPVKKRSYNIGPASPYALVDAAEVMAEFGANRSKSSPYRLALCELAKSGDGKVLRFDKRGARAQITVQAKKLGVKVLFAEQGTFLYCKLIGSGATSAILTFIRQQPRTKAQVVAHLTGLGMADVVVDRELQSLSGSGHIRLDQQKGGWVATSKD